MDDVADNEGRTDMTQACAPQVPPASPAFEPGTDAEPGEPPADDMLAAPDADAGDSAERVVAPCEPLAAPDALVDDAGEPADGLPGEPADDAGEPVDDAGDSAAASAAAPVRAQEVADAIRTLGPGEAAAHLAAAYGDEAAEVLADVLESGALPRPHIPVRTVGVYYFRFGLGGVERVTRDLMLLWQSMGYNVVLICDGEPSADDQPLPEGVRRAFVPDCFSHGGADYGRRGRALADALVANGVDLLVYCQWMEPTLPWDALVAKLLGVTFVVHTHGSFASFMAYGGPRYCALPPCYAFVDGVACLSAADERFWGTYNANARATPNPLSACVAACEPAPLDGGSTVLWVGRLSPEKHPEEALAVVAAVARQVSDVRLLMVGQGPDDYLEHLKKTAVELGVADRVEFGGRCDERQMPACYRAADVALMTSYLEGYSLVLHEALAMGVPCVLYRMPFLMMCEDERGIASAPAGDVDALAERVCAILQDGALRRQMGEQARAHAAAVDAFDRRVFWREMFDAAVAGLGARPRKDVDRAASGMWDALCAAFLVVRHDADRTQAELTEGVEWLRRQLAESQAEAARLAADNERLKGDLAAVEGSLSYRLGRGFTAPARFLRDKKDDDASKN